MPDWIDLTESLLASPALYAVLIAVSLLDSFLPLIPSEPVVILAGIAAATGQTNIMLVIAATTVGAFLGDLVPYSIGQLMGNAYSGACQLAQSAGRRMTGSSANSNYAAVLYSSPRDSFRSDAISPQEPQGW